MTSAQQLITDNIDVWTSAIKAKSTSGRGSSSKRELYGINKLRALILELAVSGKLVPQNSADEPASMQLESIAAEKAKLIKEKKIKKTKPLPAITEEEKPFELPAGWEWARIQDICRDWGQKQPESTFTYIDVGSINKEQGVISNASVIDASNAPSRARKIVKKGTVIYSTVRPYLLNIAIIDKNYEPEAIASTAFAIVHPLEGMSASYIYRYLRSPSFIKYVENIQIGVAYPAINDRQFYSGLIPIAPKNEQPRIASKVDELMALCDQLEQETEANLSAHTQLVETLLTALLQSSEAHDFNTNWQRIAQHFDTLFTTEESIDILKQHILQLAVMGKLVPQNPNDEPASKLLERITTEKAALIAAGKIKKQKPLPAITEEEKPFSLSNGWEWVRLGDLALSSEAGWSPQCKATPRVDNDWGVLKVSAVTWGAFNPDENKQLPLGLEPRPEYEVKSGDFLISRANTAALVAKAVVVPDDAPSHLMMSDKIIRFRFSDFVSALFINLVNNSMISRDYYQRVAGGTSSSMKNVSRIQIQNLLIPLPPYEEELKIINKVEQLIILCDQLKQQLKASQQTQLHLADAMVEGAL